MLTAGDSLEQIRAADERLSARYRTAHAVNPALDRRLVSFQANREQASSRWFKYREGFSVALMRYIFEVVGIRSGTLLDPFAGSGTALFAAAEAGLDAVGIELLPSSAESIEVRHILLTEDRARLADAITAFAQSRPWESPGIVEPFPHLRITSGAFPARTEYLLGRYLHEATGIDDRTLGRILRFGALCILESISYTRKDGQYLRWDHRSGRHLGARLFDKGHISGFTEAIVKKLKEIATDLRAEAEYERAPRTLFDVAASRTVRGDITLLVGSCLDILPTLPDDSFDAIVTSPPYCNRYDYTRTYALELAMLGMDEEGIKRLRQAMLSCTVENREKSELTARYPMSRYRAAMDACASQETLTLILSYLDARRDDGSINNAGIPRMVKNYFVEMALVIFECARVLKPGAPLIMVNDNVRYHGAHVPVDLILSDIARSAGFDVERIWVLPRGKGNSSQQMGAHGREELRKCVYVWRRPTAVSASRPDPLLAAVR